MSDLFVVIHTDETIGYLHVLGALVYTDLPAVERRVAERRRTAAAEGWTDHYRAYRLVPVEENAATG